MVQNPVAAELDVSAELPSLTEHVLVEDPSAKGNALDQGCEIFVPKSKKKKAKKELLKPDSVLSSGTEELEEALQSAPQSPNRHSMQVQNLMAAIALYQQREKAFQEEVRRLSERAARLEEANINQTHDIVHHQIQQKKETI